jgi:selenocysteine lyase/cysteine desulfurase
LWLDRLYYPKTLIVFAKLNHKEHKVFHKGHKGKHFSANSINKTMNSYIRGLFPAASKYTYLNSAAVAPLPVSAVNAVAAQLRDTACNGSINMADWAVTKGRVRAAVAEMLGVRSDEIAFLRNTSDGLSGVASGMKWSKGDNIVSFDREFPANFYPWRRLRDEQGVELRLCPERDGRIDAEELISMIDGNTKLVSVSAVQYSTGFRLDLERIGRETRRADALFAVDIIQAFGVLPFDLPAQYVDIAAGASYKWLCSPEGCGIFYLGERARERVSRVPTGWASVGKPWDFDDTEQDFKPECTAWETGMCGTALFYGMEQSLRLLRDAGTGKIADYLEGLTDFLCEILPARYEVASSRANGEKSQIVSLRHREGMASDDIAAHLQGRNIIVSSRGNRTRIAPHFFNNREDIQILAENLP